MPFSRDQPRQYAADSLYAGDGSGGVAYQRLHQRRLVGSGTVALSVAVGLTPEMLPMIVTSTLARGAVKLSKQKVIVKHLDAIQNFGAMDILCTDKTGTLTQDKIVLENHTDISGKTSERVLHSAWLNSHYQTGLKKPARYSGARRYG